MDKRKKGQAPRRLPPAAQNRTERQGDDDDDSLCVISASARPNGPIPGASAERALTQVLFRLGTQELRRPSCVYSPSGPGGLFSVAAAAAIDNPRQSVSSPPPRSRHGMAHRWQDWTGWRLWKLQRARANNARGYYTGPVGALAVSGKPCRAACSRFAEYIL